MPVLSRPREGGTSAALTGLAGVPRSTRRRCVELALLVALVAFPVLSGDAFLVDRVGKYLLLAAFAISVDLVWGYGGVLTFGHAVFFGGAGYVVGLLTTREEGLLPLSVWPAVGLAVAASAGVAALVAGAAFRGRVPLGGVEFALVTLALAFLFEQYARSSDVLGGQNGILFLQDLAVGGLSLHRGVGFYALAATVLVASYLACLGFLRSSSGLVLTAVRENEERVETLGYRASTVKFQAYLLSGVVAALAGALFYVHDGIITPGAVGVEPSTLVLLWVVLGGRATLLGPVVAAVVLQHLTAELSASYLDTWLLMVGVLLILTILVLPGGLLGWVTRGQMR